MIKTQNDCCECAVPAYPCLGDSCPLRHQKHYNCDSCGDEVESYIGLTEWNCARTARWRDWRLWNEYTC